jgi:hypothetical protein
MNGSWLTRPLFTVPPKAARRIGVVCLTVFAVAIILGIFSPGIYTLSWHLLHGHTIETRGQRMFVPLAWVAETDGIRDIEMMKYSRTLVGGIKFYGSIEVRRNFLAPHETVEHFYATSEVLYWNFAPDGAAVTGRTRTGSGQAETVCMESSYPKEPDRASASCVVQRGLWTVDFDGEKRDLAAFREVVQKMN